MAGKKKGKRTKSQPTAEPPNAEPKRYDWAELDIACDLCNFGIVGTRWTCRNCPDVDYCQQCIAQAQNEGRCAEHQIDDVSEVEKEAQIEAKWRQEGLDVAALRLERQLWLEEQSIKAEEEKIATERPRFFTEAAALSGRPILRVPRSKVRQYPARRPSAGAVATQTGTQQLSNTSHSTVDDTSAPADPQAQGYSS